MGPLRVVTYILWTMSFSGSNSQVIAGTTYTATFDATGAVKAFWVLNSGVTSFDKFTQFFFDVIIYGVVYPLGKSVLPQPAAGAVGLTQITDAFTKISTVTCCYNWNNYDTTGNIPYL